MTLALSMRSGPGWLPTLTAMSGLACLLALAAMPFSADALWAWVAAALFWTAIPIGAVGLLATMRLVPGRWNIDLAVFVEAAAGLLPLAALALLPLLFGIAELYPWHAGTTTGPFQEAWLQGWFFWLRTGAWLGVLAVLAWLLIGRRGRARAVASVGLIAFTLFGALIAVDWLMSMQPHFRSSGFGLYVLSIQFGVALIAACLARLAVTARPPRGLVGTLLLVMLLLWAYFAYMQYFILWSGDRPDGAAWYLARSTNGWQIALWAMIVLHALPALLLLHGGLRRHRRWLIGLIGLAAAGKLVEMAWLVLPAKDQALSAWTVPVLALAHLGLGGLFVAGYALALRRRIARRTPGAERRQR